MKNMTLERTPTQEYEEQLPVAERPPVEKEVVALNETTLATLNRITTPAGVTEEQNEALRGVRERLTAKVRQLGNATLVALALCATAPSALAQDTINTEQLNNAPVASQTFEGESLQNLETVENSFGRKGEESLSSREKDALYAITSEPSPKAEEDLDQQKRLLTQLGNSASIATTSPDTQVTSGPLGSVLEKPLRGIDDALAFPGNQLDNIPQVQDLSDDLNRNFQDLQTEVGDALGVSIPRQHMGTLGNNLNGAVRNLAEKHIPFLKHSSFLKDVVIVIDNIQDAVRSEKSPPEKFNSIMENITGFAGKLLNERLFGIPRVILGIAKPFEDKEPKPPYDPQAP